MSAAHLCHDRTYPTRHIEGLPIIVHLHPSGAPQGGQVHRALRLVVDYASTADLPDCRRLVEAAAARGDNVGLDEYTDKNSLQDFISLSEIFVGKDEGQTKTVIFISPNMEVRSPLDTCVASIHIFYSPDFHQHHPKSIDSAEPANGSYYQQLLRLAVTWVPAVDLGYTHCCVRAAACCRDRLNALGGEGFERVVTLPDSVDIAGVGLTDDYLFIKQLDDPRKHKMRSSEEVTALVDRLYPSNVESEARYRNAVLPTVPFLPQEYRFSNGTTVIIRNARKNEDELIYHMFKHSADGADGYDALEYVSLAYFRAMKMMTYYCIVFEDKSSGRVLGCEFLGNSIYTRSARSRTSISSLVLAPEFQNKGFGGEILILDAIIARQLGYRAMINDVLASNDRMKGVIRRMWGDSARDLGRFPNGAYSTKHGWDDMMVQLYPYDHFEQCELADFARSKATLRHSLITGSSRGEKGFAAKL